MLSPSPSSAQAAHFLLFKCHGGLVGICVDGAVALVEGVAKLSELRHGLHRLSAGLFEGSLGRLLGLAEVDWRELVSASL